MYNALNQVFYIKFSKNRKFKYFFILVWKDRKRIYRLEEIFMKTKIMAILLSLFCIIPMLTLAGCGKKDSASQVYFLNFKPESASAYEKLAKEYEDEKGVKVKVVTAAANTYEQTLKSEIAKNDAPTIFQINGPIGYQSWKDYCLDIKDSKLYSYLSDKTLAITDGDGVYGIPYVVEGYGIIYNKKITDKYFALKDKKTEYTSMDQIKSFDALKKLAEDMSANKEKLGIEGVFASTSLSSGEDWRWQTHLLNVPIYYELRDNSDYDDPTLAGLNSKEIAFIHSDKYKQIFDLYINNSVTAPTLLGSKSTADSMAEFALGKAAMVQNGNWAWSQIDDVTGNVVDKNDIKYLPLYVGVDGEEKQGLCIGTENYLAINKNASEEQKKASLDFLDWLFSSKTGKKYVKEELNFITPFNTFKEDEQPDDPLAREIARYMNDDNYISVPWIFTAFPSDEFKKAVGNSLLDYAQGSKKWEEVAKTVKSKWKSERG